MFILADRVLTIVLSVLLAAVPLVKSGILQLQTGTPIPTNL